MLDISPTLDPDRGSAHLETLLSCMSMVCHSHFQTCPILLPFCWETLAGLLYLNTHQPHLMTGHRTTPTVLERKPACHKQPRPDLVTIRQDGKSPCLWLQSRFHHCRTSREHNRTRPKRKLTRLLQQQTCWEVYRIGLFHFTNYKDLSVMGSMSSWLLLRSDVSFFVCKSE